MYLIQSNVIYSVDVISTKFIQIIQCLIQNLKGRPKQGIEYLRKLATWKVCIKCKGMAMTHDQFWREM